MKKVLSLIRKAKFVANSKLKAMPHQPISVVYTSRKHTWPSQEGRNVTYQERGSPEKQWPLHSAACRTEAPPG